MGNRCRTKSSSSTTSTMKQEQIKETASKGEPSRHNLLTLPEDILYTISSSIESWTSELDIPNTDEGNLEIAKAKKSRDEVLRGLAFTCRDAYSLFYPVFLSEISCFDPLHLHSLFSLFWNKPHFGRHVKSLSLLSTCRAFKGSDIDSTVLLWKNLYPRPVSKVSSAQVHDEMRNFILGTTENLQTLLLTGSGLTLPPFQVIDGRRVPSTFLTSLKNLHIPLIRHRGYHDMMSARNIIWILTFFQGLQEAILAFDMSHDDFLFLQEHSEAFRGKSSVKKLALAPTMSAQVDAQLQWGVGADTVMECKGGSKESQLLFDLLLITKGLLSLEIFPVIVQRRRSDSMSETPASNISLECLSALALSFSSLKHIRIAGFRQEENPSWAVALSKLVALKVLGVDFEVVMTMQRSNFPFVLPSVEIVHFMHYPPRFISPLMDDIELYALSGLLGSQSFPSLQQLAIPSAPISPDYKLVHSAKVMELWKVARLKLEAKDVFKSGKLELRLLGEGDTVGDASKDEDCPSSYSWVRRFQGSRDPFSC